MLKWRAFRAWIGSRLKPIGKSRYNDSVVLIKTEDGSGTGFIIGAQGYVMTCAHVVDKQTKVTVAIRNGDNASPVEKTGAVIGVDHDRDLALIKIDVDRPLKSVRLNATAKVEAGEHVTVIGNPDIGKIVLTHTMTEGIVSNPLQTIAGQKFIQTSAAVNPGTSGGPMFDSCGEVIGLVVLKAHIEGAGFAVPASEIITFLTGQAATNMASGDANRGPGNKSPFNVPGDTTTTNKTRTWTDASGQFKIEAEFVAMIDGAVQLRKPNGEIISVPVDKLSNPDREFLSQFSNKK